MKILSSLTITFLFVFVSSIQPQTNNIKDDNSSSVSVSSTMAAIDSIINKIPGTMSVMYSGTFRNNILKRNIHGKLLAVSGSFKKLGKNGDPAESIFNYLSGKSWRQLAEYAADGPDGTVFAF